MVFVLMKAFKRFKIDDDSYFDHYQYDPTAPPNKPIMYDIPKNKWKDVVLYYKSKSTIVDQMTIPR